MAITDIVGVDVLPVTALASICFAIVAFLGIFSWLRKRLTLGWWRDSCGCDEIQPQGMSSTNYGAPIKASITSQPIPPPVIYIDEFDDIRTGNKNVGHLNQAFGSTRLKGHPKVELTVTDVHEFHNRLAPPDYNQLEVEKGWNSVQVPQFQDSFRSRTTSNTGDYRLTAKVISKPSITSGYVSDTESYECPPKRQTTRKAPGGRYSGRKNVEKKRHRRKHHNRMGAKINTDKMRKYATTSLASGTILNPRAPISRRHSYAVSTHNIIRQNSTVSKPTPPPRTKKKRSASDAHLFMTTREMGNINIRKNFNINKSASFCNDKTLKHKTVPQAFHKAACDGKAKQPTNSLQSINTMNPRPIKTSTLMRSGTIMEVPIYARPTQNEDMSSGAKKTRPKPPRSHMHREKHRHFKASKRDKWQYGYGSLPADLGKIQSGMLEQLGMTAESFIDSIEKLDFDKLCRPVPNITDDQRLTSPRKPVIDKRMPGHEQELLKNTYRLEEFGIVATDL